ncbi:MAG: restriction endonuclease [Candidatus Dojkabacteria bacterium]|jgi:hypothetical protein
MSGFPMIDANYFREYRSELGFSSQDSAKSFLTGKDISPNIDWKYIEELNIRLKDILMKLNSVVDKSISQKNINAFIEEYISKPYLILKANNMIENLNNQGRRPEQVYFSWMRGYVISQYFLEALEEIFSVELDQIEFIGDDDLRNPETFKRTPKADLEVKTLYGGKIRLEIQSGFTGINDIKQHKVLEAKRIKKTKKKQTLAIHFDIYNGQVAFIPLDEIADDNVNWITRQQMEGQTVFNIDQNYFLWKLLEKPMQYKDIMLILKGHE